MLLKDTPIRRKLTLIILLTTVAALLLSRSVFFAYEFLTFRQATLRQLSTIGEVIAANSTAALAFDNQDDAKEILAALKAEQHIVAACLYDNEGKLFAKYPADLPSPAFPDAPGEAGYHFQHLSLIGFQPVVQNNKHLGTLYLKLDMGVIMQQWFRNSIGIAVVVIAIAILVAYLISKTLQKQISQPILSLAETARAISDHRDFSVRAEKHGQDEIGQLTDGFNQMLSGIQERENALHAANEALRAETTERKLAEADVRRSRDQLEVRVQERTRELAETNVALQGEVAERKKKEEDLHLANETLSQRTEDLAKKNEEVEAFVYIVSHDLRAPLVNIQGFASQLDTSCRALMECLREATVSPKTQTSVQTIIDEDILVSLRFIRASTDKFQRLIEALLTLSRTGRQDYKSEGIDVALLVRATLDSLQQSIEKSGTQVKLGQLPRAVGDLTAIGQVFGNLITNALNYLQPGRPGVIEIGGEIKDGMNHYWVGDNGVGIPETAQRRLFQVFQRFHPKLAQGEGMGLAITKRIVERHGGKIWVESQENIGTTFYFSLQPNGKERPIV